MNLNESIFLFLNNMKKNELKVISASRRVDMVAGTPEKLAHMLEEKCPPERVHTLVLWTKNADNILHHPELHSQLKKYDQLFLHYTITGMGGTMLEPFVPSLSYSLSLLSELIDFFKSPLRIRIRFDPIVHFWIQNGQEICNLDYFPELAHEISKYGIRGVSTSWAHIYPKVKSRLLKKNIRPKKINKSQKLKEFAWMREVALEKKLELHVCCDNVFPESRCIDGTLYNTLHPRGYKASENRATSQRRECGCTESWDIGWYNTCVHGCVYCYGNPRKLDD